MYCRPFCSCLLFQMTGNMQQSSTISPTVQASFSTIRKLFFFVWKFSRKPSTCSWLIFLLAHNTLELFWLALIHITTQNLHRSLLHKLRDPDFIGRNSIIIDTVDHNILLSFPWLVQVWLDRKDLLCQPGQF